MIFNWIILGLNIIILCVMFLVLRKKIDDSFKSNELFNQIESEVDRVITELNQTTDRNINLIEDRIEKLNRLLEESGKIMLVFKKEQDKLSKSKAGSAGLGIYTKPMPLKLHRVDENPQTENIQTETRNRYSKPVQKQSPPDLEQGKALSTKEKVLKLDYEGLGVSEIASQLKMSLGEIELILSLNREMRKGRG